MKTVKIQISDAKQLAISVLTSHGVSKDEAEIIADVYIEAELRGKRTHGLQVLPLFIKVYKRTPPSDIKTIKEDGNSLFVDGGCKFGPVTGTYAMNKLIAKMDNTAIAIATIKNSGHMGMLGYYPEMAANRGYIGIAMASTPALAVAYGGTDTILGSNPLAISIPTRNGPITFDMGTTEITYFKIVEARYNNEKLPNNSVLDDAGNVTTDPHKANLRKLMPLAGYKGFGLAFMIEILTSAISRSIMGKEKSGAITGEHYNTTMIVLKADAFIALNDFYDSVEKLVSDIKNTTKAKGFDKILTGVSEMN